MCASMALIALPAGMAAAAEAAAAAASQPISSPSIMPGGMLAAGHVLLDGATASAAKDEAAVPSGGAGCLPEADDDGKGALHSQPSQPTGNPAPQKESAGRSRSEAEQPASAWQQPEAAGGVQDATRQQQPGAPGGANGWQQPGDPEAWSGTSTSDDAKLVQVGNKPACALPGLWAPREAQAGNGLMHSLLGARRVRVPLAQNQELLK